ncbi:MAG: carboxypeptidase-like regulatory domain-containing protein [Acidobacteriota bacterium]|nr:carboxypeptidase-like regulatory domain-containing protein [Acidobacteriota bacterium]
MRVSRLLLIAVFFGGVTAVAAAAARDDGVLAGRVLAASQPLSTAQVYAYQTADLDLRKVLTDTDGVFLFDSLPAGLYKIIALKPGFLPAVVMLTRTTAGATQFLEVELSREPSDPRQAHASFWKVREQIPSDVLRDLDQPAVMLASNPASENQGTSLQTEMRAVTGIHESLDAGEAQVNGAQVGIEGQIRSVAIDFSGRFSELESRAFADGTRPTGTSQSMSLQVEPNDRSLVKVASRSSSLVTVQDDDASSVDFEHHRVSWSQAVGQNGHSDFSAQYTEESNYYRQALISPGWIPASSRSWRVEGTYSTKLGDRSSLEAGLRYRDRDSEYERLRRGQPLLPHESVELFGHGGVEVKPAVVIQYGLYSTMRSGGLSLAPQGGVIVKLGTEWEASTLISRRLDQDDSDVLLTEFTPTYFEDGRGCREAAIYCYEVELARNLAGDGRLSLGAVHRKVGETQRLYFDGDFLDRLDSLYLVEGDELPELQLEMTRRLGPNILTKITSNVAAGGGGLLQTDGRKTFENEVRYLVTSVDTHFEDTSTGIFIAFHRLEQELSPVRGKRTSPTFELERLQLGVTQSLDFLRSVAKDLALHLNMELSRGGTAGEAALVSASDLRKRITGGLAFRF